MCALSNHIREKPDWWEKVEDETIVEKWREEALQQAGDDDEPEWKLTPAMVCVAYRHGSCYRPDPDVRRLTTCSRSFVDTRICAIRKPA